MKRDKLAGSLKALEERRAAQGEQPPSPTPAMTAPAVAQVADSIRKLGAAAPQQVDPDEIAESRFADRLDVMEGLADLIASIRNSGQQLPVLLRRAPPDAPAGKRFEVIYGRRRIAACRVLGIPVRAHVTDFDDRQALVAQGLENAARLENSFVERARFAAQLDAAGYGPSDICETLNVDASGLSRMRTVTRSVPDVVIRAIGPAHKSGRRPWMRLAQLLSDMRYPEGVLPMVEPDRDSDDRLAALVAALEEGRRQDDPPPEKPQRHMRSLPGRRVTLSRDARRMVVQVKDRRAETFLPWLEERLDSLYAEWSADSPQD